MNTNHTNPTNARMSRRRFLIGAAGLTGAAALSACVAPPVPGVAPSTPTQAQPTSASASAMNAQSASESGFPRTIKDVDGDVVIETQPKRILALNQIALQYVAPFIGQVELAGYAKREGMAADLVEKLKGVPSFDSENLGANLELIVKWKPDLAFESDSGGYFSAAEKAVKTVNLPVIRPGSWRDSTRMIGEALGLEDYAAKLIAETDAMIQAEARPNRGTMAIAYIYDNPAVVTFETSGTALGGLLEELGFDLVAPKDPASPWEQVSLEVAAERLNVDHVFIPNYGNEPGAGIIASQVLAAAPAIAEKRYTVGAREVADAATFFGPETAKFVLEALRVLPGGANAASVAATAAYPRTIKDAAGVEVTIPARPQRVVTLQNLWDLDALLSLGIAPVQFGIRSFVGQYTGSENVSWQWHEDTLKKLGATAECMNGDEPNLEVITQAKPDLIIGMPWNLETGRDAMNKLAPAVALKVDWRESLRLAGQVFGEEEKAARIVAETDGKIANSLKDLNMGRKTAAVISCYDNKVFYGFGHPSDGRADLFQRAGFKLLEAISSKATAEENRPEFSIELLPILDPADVIVLFDYGGDGKNPSGILENPLFTRIPAVKAGKLVVLKQGELAQGLSTISPINLEFCLDVVRQAATLAMKA